MAPKARLSWGLRDPSWMIRVSNKEGWSRIRLVFWQQEQAGTEGRTGGYTSKSQDQGLKGWSRQKEVSGLRITAQSYTQTPDGEILLMGKPPSKLWSQYLNPWGTDWAGHLTVVWIRCLSIHVRFGRGLMHARIAQDRRRHDGTWQ